MIFCLNVMVRDNGNAKSIGAFSMFMGVVIQFLNQT